MTEDFQNYVARSEDGLKHDISEVISSATSSPVRILRSSPQCVFRVKFTSREFSSETLVFM